MKLKKDVHQKQTLTIKLSRDEARWLKCILQAGILDYNVQWHEDALMLVNDIVKAVDLEPWPKLYEKGEKA